VVRRRQSVVPDGAGEQRPTGEADEQRKLDARLEGGERSPAETILCLLSQQGVCGYPRRPCTKSRKEREWYCRLDRGHQRNANRRYPSHHQPDRKDLLSIEPPRKPAGSRHPADQAESNGDDQRPPSCRRALRRPPELAREDRSQRDDPPPPRKPGPSPNDQPPYRRLLPIERQPPKQPVKGI